MVRDNTKTTIKNTVNTRSQKAAIVFDRKTVGEEILWAVQCFVRSYFSLFGLKASHSKFIHQIGKPMPKESDNKMCVHACICSEPIHPCSKLRCGAEVGKNHSNSRTHTKRETKQPKTDKNGELQKASDLSIYRAVHANPHDDKTTELKMR